MIVLLWVVVSGWGVLLLATPWLAFRAEQAL